MHDRRGLGASSPAKLEAFDEAYALRSEARISMATHDRPFYRTPSGIALLGFVAVALFFLVTEHTAHFFGALPYVLLLACPLMHFFHHGRHRAHETRGER